MATSPPKLVQVNGVGVVEFPGDMQDYHVAAAIKAHTSKTPVADDNSMPGYGDVPAFLQNNLDMSKVRQVPTEPVTETDRNAIASVGGKDPYRVNVYATDLYGPPILNHELTHTFQDTRNKSLPDSSAPIKQSGRAAYDYGGIKGLQAARMQGKTIADFNAEQQADMVKDYKWHHDQYLKKAASGKITPADMKAMYELQQAYHPFIKQLASIPGANVDLDRNPLLELLGVQKPVPLGAKPEPPGLPSYDTPGLGILPADPLMGGHSQSTLSQVKAKAAQLKPKSVQVRDPHGYVHTFPNQQAADNFKREAGIQ